MQKLTDVFIIEGARDTEFRELAEICAQTFIDYVKTHECSDVFNDNGNVTATYFGHRMKTDDEVRKYFQDTVFYVKASPPGMQTKDAAFSSGGGHDEDYISVYLDVEKNHDSSSWRKFCLNKAPDLLRAKFTSIMHEFIHLIDSQRTSSKLDLTKQRYDINKINSGDEQENSKYINDPLEFNAIFQEIAERLEQRIIEKGVDSINSISSQEWVSSTLKSIPKDWTSSFSAKLRKHLIKRLYQFLEDMKVKYS